MSRRHPVQAIRIAVGGLAYLMRSESSARMNLLATAIVVLLGFVLEISIDEWRWIAVSLAFVWVAEAFNTAIERLGDAVTRENHPDVGHAKDLSATAVSLALVVGGLICLSILGPHLVSWLST
jgi:diacylglycerol kinase (ATP)